MKNNIVKWSVSSFVITLIATGSMMIYLHNQEIAGKNCNPNYSGCVTGYNCSDVKETVDVIGSDVYGLDGDGDGKGCDVSGTWLGQIFGMSFFISFAMMITTGYIYIKTYPRRIEAFKKKEHEEAEKAGLLCPKDDGILKLRNGRYGEFYGCSNYPVCLFTRDQRKKA